MPVPPPPPFTLTRLMLRDFRSYPALTLGLGGRVVVLTGENGAGKTNLLEAISLLGPGRGLRGARMAELARQGPEGPLPWAVASNRQSIPATSMSACRRNSWWAPLPKLEARPGESNCSSSRVPS